MNKKRSSKQKGFTLVELIVVIAIIGVLAAVAVPRLTGLQDNSKKKVDISSAAQIANMINMALADEKLQFKSSDGSLEKGPNAGSLADVDAVIKSYFDTGEIPKVKYDNSAGSKKFSYASDANRKIIVKVDSNTLYPEIPSTETDNPYGK